MKSIESQTVEWKQTWHDEYLKWLCAFSNTDGGVLEIGKNDKGDVVPLANLEDLLEQLPNKIRQGLGIVADVRLVGTKSAPFVSISVPKYPNPISYRGRYYRRSGSTTLEISGHALDEFILGAFGKTWDSVALPRVKVEDLDPLAFRDFRRKAIASGRLTAADMKSDNGALLESLLLMDGAHLTRAAALLFHERPDHLILGAFVKIGFFAENSDLRYQDEMNGPRATLPNKVLESLYLKFLKALISYEGIQRIETYPFPREAIREAIANAIVHKDYSSGNPIQIRVYEDRILITNSSHFPQDWTVAELEKGVRSLPFNPSLANTFYRCGNIEAWGRGFQRMANACREEGNPPPCYENDAQSVMIRFDVSEKYRALAEKAGLLPTDSVKSCVENALVCGEKTPICGEKITRAQQVILEEITELPSISARQLAESTGLSPRKIEYDIKALKASGRLRRIGPDKGGHWEVVK
jgi:ATP-dependent DNA helicase RecG